MKILTFFQRSFDLLLVWKSRVAVFLIIFITFLVSFDVLMRFFFNRPLYWATEFTEYSLLYITFLGTAWLLKNDGHVKVDIFFRILSPRMQTFLNILNAVIGLTISLILTVVGILTTLDFYHRGVTNPGLLEFPKAPLVAIIPLGFFFLMIEFGQRIIFSWREVTKRNG